MGKSTGKPSAPVDTMSVMRKLEPIYELIDAGNNKGALQAIDRDLLRKYPALQIGRVLKGIVLGRLGRFDEGRELCESVRAEGPSDDTVLNTLALYYRQNDMRAELIGAFESASERQPQRRVPQDPLLRLRPRLRPRQAAAVRHEALPPDKRPQAHHMGGVRHARPIPRRPVPHPRRRRRVRQTPRRGRRARPRDTPRVRTRLPRGGRYRRLPRTPRRTHRRRVPPHARRTRVPSRRDGVARRV